MDYDLELKRAVKGIIRSKARTVCIQLPDGLKPKAKEIADHIEKFTNIRPLIWAGSCFGSCDTPDLRKLKVDLLIQFGHSEFRK